MLRKNVDKIDVVLMDWNIANTDSRNLSLRASGRVSINSGCCTGDPRLTCDGETPVGAEVVLAKPVGISKLMKVVHDAA